MTQASLSPVEFSTLPATGGYCIGVITLNQPRSLNALTYEMLDMISRQLRCWRYDDTIAAIWLQGRGEKAFCAGADLHQLYSSLVLPGLSPCNTAHTSQQSLTRDMLAYAQAFLGKEYQLDFDIHHYPKPIVAWLHGIVMGGGVGLAHGARYRIATENATFAMPEIAIGLFPDVGASWFLNQVPARIGRFIALTAARLNAADALFTRLADLIIAEDQQQNVLDAITQIHWQTDPVHNERTLHQTLHHFANWHTYPPSTLLAHARPLAALCSAYDCKTFLEQLMQHYAREDKWFKPYAQNAAQGAPSSLHLSWTLQDIAQNMTLAQTYQMEFNAALGCCLRGDLAEGIRAQMIDKDKHPHWLPAASDEKDLNELIEFFLVPRHHGKHILAGLGQG